MIPCCWYLQSIFPISFTSTDYISLQAFYQIFVQYFVLVGRWLLVLSLIVFIVISNRVSHISLLLVWFISLRISVVQLNYGYSKSVIELNEFDHWSSWNNRNVNILVSLMTINVTLPWIIYDIMLCGVQSNCLFPFISRDHIRRLVYKYMRELLVLHFRKRIIWLNCLLANVASIALIDILNTLSPSLKDPFQFFSRNQSQNYLELVK
jgi:hypothetical protein